MCLQSVSQDQYCFDNAAKDPMESRRLYTRAIRYVLARRLATEASLYTILAGFEIAGISLLKDVREPLWMIASIICFLAVGAQTAGYDVSIAIVTIRSTP
jgi:hypothetical protein